MTNVDLQLIKDNPYQPREVDDPAHIENLARSIAADGLLQVPTARRVNGHFELAFGHSRRKAFEWLTANWKTQSLPERFDGYSIMPLNVEELSDEEMYRSAVTENVQRKDLNPIEQAKAMAAYRDQFGKNSDEIGKLFGMSGSTVRGKIRLLDLPEIVQDKLSTGAISEGAGRLAVTVSRLAPDELDEYLSDVENDDLSPDDAAGYALRKSGNVKSIGDRHFSVSQKTFGHLPELNGSIVAQSLDQMALALRDDVFEESLALMSQKNAKPREENDYDARLLHLLKPPACTACSFHAAVDDGHYCGMAECFERKAASHTRTNLLKANADSGIAIYDEEIDGKYISLNSWNETHIKWVKEKHADLRLHPANVWNQFDGLPENVEVVVVGKTFEKLNDKKVAERGEPDKGATEKEREKQKKLIAFRNITRGMMPRFYFESAAYFAPLLDGIKSLKLMEVIFRDQSSFASYFDDHEGEYANAKDAARIKILRQAFFEALIEEQIDYAVEERIWQSKKPATEAAKHIRKLADQFGAKLPKAFDQLITTMDAEIAEACRVAVETAEAA